MKFQLILLSFMVLGCFQLLDVDGLRKSGSVSKEKKKKRFRPTQLCEHVHVQSLDIFNLSFDVCV